MWLLHPFIHVALATPYSSLAETVAQTATDEYEIGRQYQALLAFDRGISDDPALTARLGRLARAVVRGSDRPDMLFQYQVLESDELNACALPGGFISVNRGLMEKMTDAEIAFVIGHEFSHVTLRHAMNGMNLEGAATEAAKLREDGLEESERPDVRRLLHDTILSVGRRHELEADLFGALTAMRAGYEPESAITALKKLAEGGPIDAPDDDSDHPSIARRVNELERGIARIRAVEAVYTEGVLAHRNGDYTGAATQFRMYLTAFPESVGGWANLGIAILAPALSMTDQPFLDALEMDETPHRGGLDAAVAADARQALERAHRIDPTHVGAVSGLGVLARLEGDVTAARTLAEAAIRLGGRRPDLLINLGNALAQGGDVKAAQKLWKEAGQSPAWSQLALLNATWSDEREGKKKKAIAGWTTLAGNPLHAARAAAHLAALGQPAPTLTTTTAPRVAEVVGGVALGASQESVIAALGIPERSNERETEREASWRAKGVTVRFRDDRAVRVAYRAPGAWALSSGVAVGTPAAEAYAKLGVPDGSMEEWGETVAVYARLRLGLHIEDGKVSEIWLGSRR